MFKYLYFWSMADRPADQENYKMDAHWYRVSSTILIAAAKSYFLKSDTDWLTDNFSYLTVILCLIKLYTRLRNVYDYSQL